MTTFDPETLAVSDELPFDVALDLIRRELAEEPVLSEPPWLVRRRLAQLLVLQVTEARADERRRIAASFRRRAAELTSTEMRHTARGALCAAAAMIERGDL